MLDVLQAVHQHLQASAVSHALIGAAAMSVAGYLRATQDLDLLVIDQRVLNRSFWDGFAEAEPVIHDGRGDWSDPLAGVVRFEEVGGPEQVDIVVGRHPGWQRSILARATPTSLSDTVVVPVAAPADLVLLKLFAGSFRDDSDIRMLLQHVPGLRQEVEALVGGLPEAEQRRWGTLTSVGSD